MDDRSGWTEVLVEGWGPLVRAACVDRVERATVGWRGALVRTLADPDHARYAWTERIHALVVAAIRTETGADLDEIGSQAAWACYDDTWRALATRWAGGGSLPVLPREHEDRVTDLLARLPPAVAQHAGADISVSPPRPLRLGDRVRVDVEGLWACIALDEGTLTDADRALIDELIACCTDG